MQLRLCSAGRAAKVRPRRPVWHRSVRLPADKPGRGLCVSQLVAGMFAFGHRTRTPTRQAGGTPRREPAVFRKVTIKASGLPGTPQSLFARPQPPRFGRQLERTALRWHNRMLRRGYSRELRRHRFRPPPDRDQVATDLTGRGATVQQTPGGPAMVRLSPGRTPTADGKNVDRMSRLPQRPRILPFSNVLRLAAGRVSIPGTAAKTPHCAPEDGNRLELALANFGYGRGNTGRRRPVRRLEKTGRNR